MKALIILAAALLTSCGSSPAKQCSVEPAIFCEPFSELAAEMPNSEKEALLAVPADKYWRLHFGFGMGIRNRFDLWGDNEITRFFRRNGIDHPDNMSGPFIGGFAEYLRGGHVDMVRAVGRYRIPPPPPPPPPRNEAAQPIIQADAFGAA